MRSLKILSLACLISLSQANTTKASRNFDADNPPNPMDAKNVTLTIFNKTDTPIKTSFFLENKKVCHGKIIEPGNQLIFDVEGRYNKKRAYFKFRIPGDKTKGTGVRFFYKKEAKARGIKIDEIYLLQDNQGNFVISTTPEINQITTLLKADIHATLPPAVFPEKRKKSNKNKVASKKHKISKHKTKSKHETRLKHEVAIEN